MAIDHDILSVARIPFRHPGVLYSSLMYEATAGIAPAHRPFAEGCVTASPRGHGFRTLFLQLAVALESILLLSLNSILP